MRLQFEWRNSPGFWGLMSNALEFVQTITNFYNAVGSHVGRIAVCHVRVYTARIIPAVSVPAYWTRVTGSGCIAGDPLFRAILC